MFEKLQKRKGAKSTAVKVMTIDQVYEQNQKVLKKEAEEQKAREAECLAAESKASATETKEPLKPRASDTVRGFLEHNSLSRSDTIPKLTVTDDLSSDDVCAVRFPNA